MLTIIYPYRNRDLKRLRNSFDSLKGQKNHDFEVFLVDYGSNAEMAQQVERLCQEYDFINYEYKYTSLQPWNKSRALNSVIKRIKSSYCFVADVDIVFHPCFIEIVHQIKSYKRVVYFQVGFLDKKENFDEASFQNKNIRRSTKEVTGMSLFPVNELKNIRGFDEFYHFWGAEDTDVHIRLGNAGIDIEFYEKKVLLLHQWHLSYRRQELSRLSEVLQLSGIVQINHQRLKQAKEKKKTIANNGVWGRCPSKEEINILLKSDFNYSMTNQKDAIDEFLFAELAQPPGKVIKIRISKDPFNNSLKYKAKKMLGKNIPQYYSLKEINDKILLHLISFYRENPYYFRVHSNLEHLELAIKF